MTWKLPFAVTLVAMFALQLSNLGFAPLLPSIQDEFAMSYTQLGLFTGMYGLLAMVLSVPAGVAAKRVGERRILAAGLLGVAAGSVRGTTRRLARDHQGRRALHDIADLVARMRMPAGDSAGRDLHARDHRFTARYRHIALGDQGSGERRGLRDDDSGRGQDHRADDACPEMFRHSFSPK